MKIVSVETRGFDRISQRCAGGKKLYHPLLGNIAPHGIGRIQQRAPPAAVSYVHITTGYIVQVTTIKYKQSRTELFRHFGRNEIS